MRRSSGYNADYARLRDAREARRREVEAMLGWSDEPGRAMSKSQARRIAIRSKSRKNLH